MNNFFEMSNQEIFNIVWNGLKGQGFVQSIGLVNGNGQTGCMYRGANGTKCAAGHIIPDVFYNTIMENTVVNNVSWFNKNFMSPQLSFISELQDIHDSTDSIVPEKMELDLRRFAAKNNLKVPE